MTTLDSRAFRRTVGRFTTGVTVIAVEAAGEVHGMTANSFTSVSLDPMLVLFCVGKHSRTGALLQKADGFSVSILNEQQQALAAFFAGNWKEPSPPAFRFVPWNGGLRLDGCDAAIGCVVHQVHDAGDHWILIGRVVALYDGPDSDGPLLFFKGHYRRMESDNGGRSGRGGAAPDEPPIDPFESEAI